MNAGLTRRQWLGGAAALGVSAALPAFPALAQEPMPWPEVTRLIASYVDARKVSGMVATLGFGEAEPTVIAAGLDSFTSARRSDLRSIYRIYSMTKPITGMAAMVLIDEGKLGLDQPLHEILPRFRTMQVQKVYDGPVTPDNLEPAQRPITIRQLLTHTSGLGYGVIQTGPIVEAYRNAGVVPGQFTRLQALIPALRGTPAPSLELFADNLAELPLVYQPGTKWSYSMGLDVIGRVIEVVSGQPFDRFLEERFFDPLGMTDTHFQVPREDADRLVTSYYANNGGLLPIDLGANSIYLEKPKFPFGGAGLASTPRDYDRFLEMLLNYGELDGTRVMSERAVRLGTSNLLPDAVQQSGGFDRGGGFGAGGRVGLGTDAGLYGWTGAAGTFGFVHFPLRLRAGLYTQYLPVTAYPLSDDFPAAVRADLAAMIRPVKAPAFSGQPLDRADHLRSDPAQLAELLVGDARLLRLDGLVPELDGDGGLIWDIAAPSDAELVFLGLAEGRAHFAAVPAEGNVDPAYAQRPIWGMLGLLSADDLALYGTARSVLDWHARHRFCARCGQPTALAKGGWQRDCPKETGGCGAQHFPRVDPVAIMLVEYPDEHGGRLLLGRQARFPPRSYSALAGFVEPGESIEDAVRREVFEEAGVRVGEVRYLASQPWPFPSQLMLGCLGFAESLELTVDTTEIEDARWFTRAEVAEALTRGQDSTSFLSPPSQAIARTLLEWWLENAS